MNTKLEQTPKSNNEILTFIDPTKPLFDEGQYYQLCNQTQLFTLEKLNDQFFYVDYEKILEFTKILEKALKETNKNKEYNFSNHNDLVTLYNIIKSKLYYDIDNISFKSLFNSEERKLFNTEIKKYKSSLINNNTFYFIPGNNFINLINLDLEPFKKLLPKPYGSAQWLSDSINDITETINKILNYKTDSLHIKLFQHNLLAYLDHCDYTYLDSYDGSGSIPSKFNPDSVYNLLNNSYFSLINSKSLCVKIFNELFTISGKNEFKSIFTSISEELKLELLKLQNKKIDELSVFPISTSPFRIDFKNNIFTDNITFSTIGDLCCYELFRIHSDNIEFRKCKYCEKFFFVNHDSRLYCSDKCKGLNSNEGCKTEFHKAYKYRRNKIRDKIKSRINFNKSRDLKNNADFKNYCSQSKSLLHEYKSLDPKTYYSEYLKKLNALYKPYLKKLNKQYKDYLKNQK